MPMTDAAMLRGEPGPARFQGCLFGGAELVVEAGRAMITQ